MTILLLGLVFIAAGCERSPTEGPSSQRGPSATPAQAQATSSENELGKNRAAGGQKRDDNASDRPPRDQEVVTEAVDAAKLECARNRLQASSGEELSLEDKATEGGWSEIWSSDGKIVRIRGGLLFESKRLRFDYVFDDSALLCAHETTSNLNVIAEGSPGWESFWHRQHLIFDSGDLIWSSHESTSGHEEHGRDVVEVQNFAQELLEEARASRTAPE